MGVDHPSTEATEFGQISRLKGRAFEVLSMGASVFGIFMLAVLLVFVVVDAFGLDEASPLWLGTYFVTLVLPFLGFCLYSARDRALAGWTVGMLGGGAAATFVGFSLFEALVRPVPRLSWHLAYLFVVVLPVTAYVTYLGSQEPMGRVGFGLLGRLLGGTGLGFALVILFVVFDPQLWLWALTFGVLPGLALSLYSRRTPASPVELFVVPVVVGGFVVATRPASPVALGAYFVVLSVPIAVELGRYVTGRTSKPVGRFATGLTVLVALAAGATSAVIGVAPLYVLLFYVGSPSPYALYVLTLVVPVAVAVTVLSARQTTPVRAVLTGASTLVLVVGGSLVAPMAGIGEEIAVLFLLTIGIPTVTFVRKTLDSDRTAVGLVLPVLVLFGVAVGMVLTNVWAVAGPDFWLNSTFLTNSYSQVPELAGFYPAIVGSVFIIAMVAVFSFVLGVGTAVFLEEYTPESGPVSVLTRLIQINIANLAAVPSVVYGLLGLGVFINLLGMGFGTVLTASLTLSLLILPITIISAQEAIRSVPNSMRNGSYGMGATRWQTTKHVVLPQAVPGILTGTILSLGRAIGETAPLIMIGAPHVLFNAPGGIREKTTAMPMQIFVWSDSAQVEFQYGVLAAGVVTLLVVLLGMNATAIIVRNRYERRT